MQANEIIRLIRREQEPTPNTLSQLNELVERYPWFSIAHQLRLKAMYIANSEAFSEVAHLVSAYTLNRGLLYDFLYHSPLLEEEDEFELASPNLPDESFKTVDAKPDTAIPQTPPPIYTPEPSDYFALEAVESEPKLSDSDLLDKFIEASPRIIPQVAYTASEPVLTDDIDGIASEPLAEVYLSQGLYDKAISVYKQLSLQNPEKRAYFASLIKAAIAKGKERKK